MLLDPACVCCQGMFVLLDPACACVVRPCMFVLLGVVNHVCRDTGAVLRSLWQAGQFEGHIFAEGMLLWCGFDAVGAWFDFW